MKLEFSARQILTPEGRSKPEILYENDEFARLKFHTPSGEGGYSSAEVLADALKKDDAEFLYLSVPVKEGDEVLLALAELGREISDPAFGTALGFEEGLPLVWMPKSPVVRRRDRFGRIRGESECQTIIDNETLHVIIPDEGMLEICWIVFYKEKEKYLEEVVAQTPWEQKRFTVLGSGGYIECPADFFNYLIGGNLYRLFPAPCGRTTAGDEAYSVYLIAETLARLTGKNLYRMIQREIAYSLLVSLEATGRWRHGSWTDDMETHTRYQADGIDLLLHYYRHTGRQDFLKAASQAARFLLSIAEEVSQDGLWFLHDTLEVAPSDYYLSGRYLQSKAFGKSPRNMYVLNTHLNTLRMFFELQKELSSDTEIATAIDRGWSALQDILQARPAEWLYRWLSRLLDNGVAFPRGRPGRLNQTSAKPVRYAMRWILAYSRQLYPRLVMPSGFIDISLGAKGFDYKYHLVHLWDLLRIYRYQPEPWLPKIIEQGINYSLRSNMGEYAFQVKIDNIEMLGEILQLYTAITPDFERDTLANMLTRLKQIGGGVTPGLLGFDTRVVPAELQFHNIRVRDRDVDLINISNSPGYAEFLVMNSSPTRKEVSIETQQVNPRQRMHRDSLVMIDSKGEMAGLPEPHLILPPWDYVSLRFQYDSLKDNRDRGSVASST